LIDNSAVQEQTSAGLDAFIVYINDLVYWARATGSDTTQLILRMGEDCAHIRLGDVDRPVQFLRQMAGAPPVRFGTRDFRFDILDDVNPARHYTAFVFVGFWLSPFWAICLLWAWEVASFIRYRGHWSQKDIRSGKIGIRHGRLVRRYGATILPALIASELSEPQDTFPPNGCHV
jgi:hypothetical protein